MAATPLLETVARNVRDGRARLGLTLDQLAARSGVSKGALVAVEGGAANPNLATLVRLADALGVPVSELVAAPAAGDVRVVAADEADPLWRGPAGGTARLLLTTTSPAPVEIWRWRLAAGERYESQPHAQGMTETVTVLSGTLGLEVDGRRHTLPAGSTAAYRGDAAHAYAAVGRRACEFLMTVHLPPAG